MAERKAAKKATRQPAKRTTGKTSKGFTDGERAAMRERAQELKAASRRGQRACPLAENLVRDARLRQGRQCRLLLPMWPTSFALKELTPAEEKKLGALVKKALSR